MTPMRAFDQVEAEAEVRNARLQAWLEELRRRRRARKRGDEARDRIRKVSNNRGPYVFFPWIGGDPVFGDDGGLSDLYQGWRDSGVLDEPGGITNNRGGRP